MVYKLLLIVAFDWVRARRLSQCCLRVKNNEMFLTDVDHVSRQICLDQEIYFGGYELCGTRSLVGQLSLCYMLKV